MLSRDTSSAARAVLFGIIPHTYEKPADWSAKNIRFTHAKDPIQGPIDFARSPYLIEPINAWELIPGQGLKEVTVVAPQQGGKSLSWMSGLLWSMGPRPSLNLIYYTSDEKAIKVNEEKIDPMLNNIPTYRELLELPNAKTADRYRLGENLIYFGGVGTRVASFSARHCVADEMDDWKEEKGTNSLNDMRNRAWQFPEAILYKVCTPKGTDKKSRIWREFLDSSQGYWHLRCLRCGALTIRSCDIVRLQFKLDSEGNAVADSIRLICPKCGREHIEEEKRQMNLQGGYIHLRPERIPTRPGFQWGALASPLKVHCWTEIARFQLLSGKSGRLEDQIFFDNSIRGRPFKVRMLDTQGVAALKRHATPLPDQEEIKFRFLSVDTQDKCFFWVVRGIDKRDNTFLLASGRAADVQELDVVWEGTYHGGKLNCGIIDEGGHRVDEVRDFVREKRGFFTYKGNPRIGKPMMLSDNQKGLILANPHHYHEMLLHNIYTTYNRNNFYWYVTDELPDDYKEQITSWRPNPEVKNGHEIENFICPDGNDHYFDCEKMMLVLLDYFRLKILPALIASRAKKR